MSRYTNRGRHSEMLDVNRIPGQPKRRKKITLVFDENKRREFLGGFRKRKSLRQQKAQEALQQQLKEDRRRIKQEARERTKLLLSNRDVPEIEQLLLQHEYETDGHTVSILELNVADLAEGDTWIGENKQQSTESEDENDNQIEHSDNEDTIVGMSLNKNEDSENLIHNKLHSEKVNSKKDSKREMKHTIVKEVKKTKAFQKMQRIDRAKGKRENKKKMMIKLKNQKQNKKDRNKQKQSKQEGKHKKKFKR